MKVLIGCEFSGIVRDAFRARGHDAWSCDILECEKGKDWHIQGDIMNNLWAGWDLVILHPPCTKIALCSNKHYANGKPRHNERVEAIDWTELLWNEAISQCPKVALENPRNCLGSGLMGRHSQTIHPWQFGHPEQKETWLWLRGLPLLRATKDVRAEMAKLPKCRRQRVFYMGQRNGRRAMDRSRTYQGIADAMAEQWAVGVGLDIPKIERI